MEQIYIVEDDPIMAECLALAVQQQLQSVEIATFRDAVAAMNGLGEKLPDLILLDVLLSGPDGFTFLNELMSYQDTAQIPVILVSSLDFSGQDLSHYGVVQVLDKATMTPAAVATAVQTALRRGK